MGGVGGVDMFLSLTSFQNAFHLSLARPAMSRIGCLDSDGVNGMLQSLLTAGMRSTTFCVNPYDADTSQ